MVQEALFAPLAEALSEYMDEEQIHAIHDAFKLAYKAHGEQTRSSGELYITHPLEVARILAEMHLDSQSIMAAILHDVLEDTIISKEDLKKQFGESVAELVDGVSKLTQIKFGSKAEAQAENFRKMVLAMVRDIRVILIKLADRLHNMRTIQYLPFNRRIRIAKETLEIHAPIANRLGMHNFCVEFEDLGFAAFYPMRYRILQESVRKARGNRREIVGEIEQSLKTCVEEAKLPAIKVWGREKHLYSIYKKMRNRHVPFNEIMDVYGFRVVVDCVDSCYRVLGAIHNLYKPVPERFKDYIAIPKANGYQSLHTTLFGPFGVPIEVQIRTESMDHVAETGIASHWLYKTSDSSEDRAQIRAREWLKGLLEMQQSAGDSLEFIENVKIDLYPDEVYVFTPRGDIIKLPSGATAVDYAYAVHSDIGNCCVAAKINRRLAPLSTPLSNGQTVEIITAPGAGPNPAWQHFVKTGKARSNIRHFLKSRQQAESIILGKRLLEKALSAYSSDLDTLSKKQVSEVLKDSGFKTFDDLLESTGMGDQMPLVLAQRLLGTGEMSDTQLPGKAKPLSIRGSEGMVVQFAPCCRPIPGDCIAGVFSKGQGIVVHQDQCKVLEKYRDQPDRYLDVRWEDSVQGEFSVDVKVEVINRRGILATLTLAVADAGANIDDIRVTQHVGEYCEVDFTIAVRHRVHLAKVMRRLRLVKAVAGIKRRSYGDS